MQRWQRTSPVSAMRIWLFFFALAIPVVPLARAAEHQPLNIESRLELFVDRFLIDRLEGTRLELHRPRPAGVVIRPDTPWEKNARYADPPYGWGRLVIKDADRYVMYYQVVSQINYAESLDGIHWKKPILGLIEVQGNRNNNGGGHPNLQWKRRNTGGGGGGGKGAADGAKGECWKCKADKRKNFDHSPAQCWTLHPELLPEKFRKKKTKT